MSLDEDRIHAMYADRCLLITGGTGFMGKVLLEKLLRNCTKIKKFYLLVRTKKGRSPEDRLEDIFSNPLFDMVKQQRGLKELIGQCKIIAGDVTLPDLGISEPDKEEIIDNVSIIYHCAATIRFDERLKKAVLLNARGTKLMLDLAQECKHLDLFCHVSTSYCHLHEKLLLEKPYQPPADPHKIIKTIEWLDEDIVDAMTSKILGDLPNTYAFTKALGESLVCERMNDIPAIILRPSIVIPIYKEPIPGWTDNINGPTGLLIGAGKGVIRSMYCKSSDYGDFLPVDYAVNGLIVSTWNFISNNDQERRIIHLTSSAEVKVSWQQIIEIGLWVVENKIPLNWVMWYPGGSMKSTRLHHKLCTIFYHWLPAILIDILLFCIGQQPILCRVHRRIEKGFEVFEYYANNQWDFDNSNVRYMRTIVNETERKKYSIENQNINVLEYFTNCTHAARLYILKETDDQLPTARRHMKVMYWVDKICKFFIVGAFIYYLVSFFLRRLL